MDLVKQNILDIIGNSNKINCIIQSIKGIDRENLFLTGGSLRNIIWNNLHYYSEEYELEDCDIIFYNSTELTKDYEESIKNRLEYLNPNFKWSVKNQARMHIRNGHAPYNGIYGALKAFPETCSAVAIDQNLNIVAPYGLNDLYNLTVSPTQFCIDNEIAVYDRRLRQKKWINKWMHLKFGNNTHVNSCFAILW
ncbi:MAG: nucleotidyltransferase family protein [Chitinophagales bacterium]